VAIFLAMLAAMARGTCSICDRPGGPEIVNELLSKQSTLDEIAEATGFHRSSIDRHKHGNCPFSFPKYKAAKVKAGRTVTLGGRMVVRWPSGELTLDGEAIPASQLRETDVLFAVEYEKLSVGRMSKMNVRALAPTEENLSLLHELAEIEDRERAQRLPEVDEVAGPKENRKFIDRIKELFQGHQGTAAVAVQPPSPPPKEIQAACHHVMVPTVPGGRCSLCGFQPPKSQPRGLSKSKYSGIGSGRGKYGRFGS
jgi:hypothetical protein